MTKTTWGSAGTMWTVIIAGVTVALVFADVAGAQTCRTLGPQPASTFADASDPAVAAVVEAGMMPACDIGLFCPDDFVTRGSLAVVAEMTLHRDAPTWLPGGQGTVWSDLPSRHPLACWIEAATAEGIFHPLDTACAAGALCPELVITRAQMAVAVVRLKHVADASYQPPAYEGMFTDVPASHWASSWIEQAVRECLAVGVSASLFDPEGAVTRLQLAQALQQTQLEACVDTTAPAAVTDLAASDATTGSIKLSWTAPGDDGNSGTASAYAVRYSTTPILGEATWASATQVTEDLTPSVAGTVQTYTVTSLSPSTSYFFALKTADEVPNWSDVSNSPGLATLASCTSPGMPLAPSFTSVAASTVTVGWVDIANEAGYQVQRCQGAGCTSFADVGPLLSPGTASFADEGLTASTSYRYRIVAVAEQGCVSQTGPAADVTTSAGCTTPGVPGEPSFNDVTASSVRVGWTDVVDEIGYQIQRCQGAGCVTFADVGAQLAAGTTSYQDSGLAASTVYRYRLVAVAASGCTSQTGPAAGVTTASADGYVVSGRVTTGIGQGLVGVRLCTSPCLPDFSAYTDADGYYSIALPAGGWTIIPEKSGFTFSPSSILLTLGPDAGGRDFVATSTGVDLTVTKTGTGTGTVSSSPAGISCGATCAASFVSGTSVTLTATPGPGSTFDGWGGACTGSGSCVVTMTAETSVTAAFSDPSGTGLVGRWALDDGAGASAVDSSGNGNTASLVGGPSWIAGKDGLAVDFVPGIDQYVEALNVPVDTTPGGHNTVAFWIAWQGSLSQAVFSFDQVYALFLSSAGFGFNTGSGDVLGIPLSDLPQDDGSNTTWVHVAAVFYNGVPSPSTVKLYIDGVPRTVTQRVGATTSSKAASSTLWWAGFVGWPGWNHFSGAIDDLRVYDRELSASEIQALAGTATYSITGNVGVAGASVTAGSRSAVSENGGSFTITGLAAGTYIVTPALSGFVFTPASTSVTIGPDATGVDFGATDVAAPVWEGVPALSAGVIDATSVSLSWPPAEDNVAVESYRIDVDGQIGSELGPATSTVLTGLQPGTAYHFDVMARDAEFNWGTGPGVDAATLGSLSAPNLLAPTEGEAPVSRIGSFEWSSVAGADSYTLQISTDASFATSVIDEQGLEATSWTVPPGQALAPGTTFYWRVTAVGIAGTSTSASRGFTTYAALPCGSCS